MKASFRSAKQGLREQPLAIPPLMPEPGIQELKPSLRQRKCPNLINETWTFFMAGQVARNWNTVRPSLIGMYEKLKGLELAYGLVIA